MEAISSVKPGAADLDNAGPAGPGKGLAVGRVERFGGQAAEGAEPANLQIARLLDAGGSGDGRGVSTSEQTLNDVTQSGDLVRDELFQSLTADLTPTVVGLQDQFGEMARDLSRAPYSQAGDTVDTATRIG